MLISIYTPTFNSGRFIIEAYRSLCGQTHKDWEWVVVDDGSADSTPETMGRIATEDKRVRFYRQAHCGRVGEVKDIATRLCRGEVVVELDHDDQLTDNALAEIGAAFEANPDAGMVYANCAEYNDADGSPHKYEGAFWVDRYRPFTYKGRDYLECRTPDVYSLCDGMPCAWFLTVGPNHPRAFRASTLRALGGYNPSLPVADDFDLTARMFLRSRIVQLDKCLYLYRWRADAGNGSQARNAEVQKWLAACRLTYKDEFAKVPPPAPKPEKAAGLAVLAIAKDEAKALPGFIEQFKGLTDHFAILVDKASSDGTHDLAVKLGAKIEGRAFTRFDEQRNAALEFMGQGPEWFVPLDPDERLDPATIATIPELMKTKDADVFFGRLFAKNRDGSETEWPGKPFLVRNIPGMRWVGAVHETLIGSRRCVQVTNSRIVHDISLHDEAHRAGAEDLYARLSALPRPSTEGFPTLGYGHLEDVSIRKVRIGPLVSVIIPTYDRPELLAKAIASVRAQDYYPLEIIVVGDNCPSLWCKLGPCGAQGCKNICHAYGCSENPLAVDLVENLPANHKDWGGAARNRGLELARGEWVAYLDDDNQWAPNHLSGLMSAIEYFRADYGIASLSVGGKMLKCSEPVKGRVDASAILHRKALASRFGKWREGAEAEYANDWLFVEPWVKAKLGWACTNKATVLYNLATCGQREFLEGVLSAV